MKEATRHGQADAYQLILDAIDTGTYRPGDRLVESELAERFGVSRTPIREALQRLETQSLLARDGRSLIVDSPVAARPMVARKPAPPAPTTMTSYLCSWSS